jgi:hypothetical protein
VAELDPPVADALLELLREAGVAAYVEPSQGRRGPYLDVQMSGAPRDRLYVDRAHQDQARAIVSDRLAALRGMLETEPRTVSDVTPAAVEDEAWSALVARFHEPATDPVPRWPVIEDVDEPPAPPTTPDADEPPAPASSAADERDQHRRSAPEGGGPVGVDPEDHFVPPPPPPLPRLDPVSRIAWAGLLGGPGLLVFTALSGQLLPSFVVAWAVVAFIAGFLTLVVRMKDQPPDEGQPGGGAVL